MAKYAAKTTVNVRSSQEELEDTLKRYGADQFVRGWGDGFAYVAFRIRNRQVRFMLPMPDEGAQEFKKKYRARGNRWLPGNEYSPVLYEQACRQRWRALNLVVKAKLEAVDSGISTLEHEFLSWIVLPDGKTVGETIAPQIEQTYLTGHMPPLLACGAK